MRKSYLLIHSTSGIILCQILTDNYAPPQRKIGYFPWELGANLYCSCFIGEMEKNKRVKDSSDLPPLVTRHEIFIIIIMIIVAIQCAVLCLVTQSCPTLCNLMDCSPPGSSVHGDSPGKNTIVGCHVLLQGIVLTQELSPGLPHCRQILYHLNNQGSPRILEWVAYPFCRESSQHKNQTRVSCIAGGFLPDELPGKPIQQLFYLILPHSVKERLQFPQKRGRC